MAAETFRSASAAEKFESELELRGMGLASLRAFWSSYWGRAPRLGSAELLRLMIAWRLQAAQFGGLDDVTVRQLRARAPVRRSLPVGARLTREYRGILHTVEVGDGTLTYAGRNWRSLSQIASEITGTHWSGPRFFGLTGS